MIQIRNGMVNLFVMSGPLVAAESKERFKIKFWLRPSRFIDIGLDTGIQCEYRSQGREGAIY
jgi:hypothetical protein